MHIEETMKGSDPLDQQGGAETPELCLIALSTL